MMIIVFGCIGAAIGGPFGVIIGVTIGIFILVIEKKSKKQHTDSDEFLEAKIGSNNRYEKKPADNSYPKDQKEEARAKDLQEKNDSEFESLRKYSNPFMRRQEHNVTKEELTPEAQYNLGLKYENSNKDSDTTLPKAKYWYSKAAAQGHAEAQVRLALLYQIDFMIHRNDSDHVKAIEWFSKAASQGHEKAQSVLNSLIEYDKKLANFNNFETTTQGHSKKQFDATLNTPPEVTPRPTTPKKNVVLNLADEPKSDLDCLDYLGKTMANVSFEDPDILGYENEVLPRENPQQRAIQEYAEEINIPYLVHFTNSRNIDSILRHGILPKDNFNTLSIKATINDINRWDNCIDAVSLSVAFPNSPMFYKYRNLSPNEKWAVLFISPTVLWKQNCVFCAHNAADKRMRYVSIEERQHIKAFKAMFSELEGCDSRVEKNLDPFFTTDVQAEILVFGRISPSNIIKVTFDDKHTSMNFQNNYPHVNSSCDSPNRGFFGLRDYATCTQSVYWE